MNKNRVLNMLLIALLIAIFAYAFANNIISVTMNGIIAEYALDGARQGQMTSMMNVGAFIALLVVPLLQGRLPKLWLVLICMLLQTLMVFVIGAAAGMPLILAGFVLMGAGGGMIDSLTNSYMVDLYPEDSAKKLGMLHGVYGIGGLITPLLITALLARRTWRASYTIIGAIILALTVLFMVFGLPNYRAISTDAAQREKKLTGAQVKSYLLNRRNLLLIITSMLYSGSQLGIAGWMVRYMTVRFDAAELGSVCVSIFWICATISRFLAPKLRVRPIKLFIGGTLCGGVMHALGVIVGVPAFMPVVVGICGLVSGHCLPVLIGEAAVGNEDRTSLSTSVMLFATSIARILAPILLGAVTTSVSAASAMMLPAVMALLAAFFAYLAAKPSKV